MRRLIIPALVLVALIVAACCDKGTYTPKPGEVVPNAIAFIDSFSFDRDLSRAMAVQHEAITVTFPAAITLNSIPDRLDKWLFSVDESGGVVEAAPEPDAPLTRGILEEIFTFFISLGEEIADACTYSPSEKYDAMLLYRPASGIVTRVVFTLRPQITSDPAVEEQSMDDRSDSTPIEAQ